MGFFKENFRTLFAFLLSGCDTLYHKESNDMTREPAVRPPANWSREAAEAAAGLGGAVSGVQGRSVCRGPARDGPEEQ